ncbi:MAG TPA: hypothetical protein VF215_16780, partial [Thermoanaerobaculia bacterium]
MRSDALRLLRVALGIVAAWMAAGVFFATQNYAIYVSYGLTPDLPSDLFAMLVSTFLSALLTPFLLYAAERAPVTRGNIAGSMLKLAVPVLLFAIAHALFDAWSPNLTDGGPLSRDEFFAIAAATLHPHFLLAVTVVTIANLARARRENAARIVRERQIENDLSRAQRQLLHAEMQPHF